MINERIAVGMLNSEAPDNQNDPQHTKQFYTAIQAFAAQSLKLSEGGKFKKLQQSLKVAFKLFNEGNETVKNGIVNVYLFTLSRSMELRPAARKRVAPFMPRELRKEYAKLLYASGM